MNVLRWIFVSSLTATLTATAALAIVLREAPQAQPAGLPGELVYQSGSTTWRLQQGECAHVDLVDTLTAEGRISIPRLAVFEQGGRKWPGCWAQDFDSDVLLVDITGTTGFLPRSWFRPGV